MLFQSSPPRAAIFYQLVGSKPRGYFSESDVPLLEKLANAHAQYDALMRDYGEGDMLIQDPMIPGVLKEHPAFAMMRRLEVVILALTKHFSLSPSERGRPIVDDKGRPVVNHREREAEDPTKTAKGRFLGRTRTGQE